MHEITALLLARSLHCKKNSTEKVPGLIMKKQHGIFDPFFHEVFWDIIFVGAARGGEIEYVPHHDPIYPNFGIFMY